MKLKLVKTSQDGEHLSFDWLNPKGKRVAHITLYEEGLIEFRGVKGEIGIESVGHKNETLIIIKGPIQISSIKKI